MQRLQETSYSRIERNRLQIRCGYIVEINPTYNRIVFRSQKPDGSMEDFQADISYTGNLKIGTAVDFRFYARSQNSTALEIKGLTPPEMIPEWAKIRP